MEKIERHYYSGRLGPCEVHEEFAPGCVHCFVKQNDALRADLRAVAEALTTIREIVVGDRPDDFEDDEEAAVGIAEAARAALARPGVRDSLK
jgi:hypothetical protein